MLNIGCRVAQWFPAEIGYRQQFGLLYFEKEPDGGASAGMGK